ncbi:MAG: nuclease [Cyanobacteriota bacterium]|nr:nuclease [Cyanobacteriota bacterium]
MNRILLDTNILLRAADPASSQYSAVVEAVAHLLETGWECVITPQVVIEFWVVPTRPNQENGLGWTVEQAATEVTSLLNQFALLEDNSQIFTFWMDDVTAYLIKGKASA